MEYDNYYRHISIEDFKKLDVNQISYVQMNNGEILIIDHPIIQELNSQKINNNENSNNINDKNQILEKKSKNENKNKKRKKRKKNKNKNNNNIEPKLNDKESNIKYDDNNNYNHYDNYYDNYYDYNYNQDYDNYSISSNYSKQDINEEKFILPKEYFKKDNIRNRPNSVQIKNKRIVLFNEEWKPFQYYDFNERIKFYDAIPKRAKYWENESYDSTRSSFNIKRYQKHKMYEQNNLYNQYINNYTPIKQDSSSVNNINYINPKNSKKEYEGFSKNSEGEKNTNLYSMSNDNQANQYSKQKLLYELVFGPQFAQYILGQQPYNYQSGQYGQEQSTNNNNQESYSLNIDDSNYYNYENYNPNSFYQMNQNNYDYYYNNFDYYNNNEEKNLYQQQNEMGK